MSQNRDKTKERIIISDDGDWPALLVKDVREEIECSRERNDQSRNATLLTVMSGGLFLIYTIYAMFQGDIEMLRGGFDLVKFALVASVSWTFGRRSLPRP